MRLRLRCPKCPPDTRPNLSVDPTEGFFRCHRCGQKGKLKKEQMAKLGVRERAREEPKRAPQQGLPSWSFPLWGSSSASLLPFQKYLRRRQVAEQEWGRGRLHACVAGWYSGRVVFPLLDVLGAILGFQARTIHPGVEPPYLHSRGFPRRTHLYNEPALVRLAGDVLYVVEGPVDAIRMGLDWAVATLGKEATSEQLDLIARTKRPVCVALDGDAWQEGRLLASRLALRRHLQVGWVKLPPGEDPGSLGGSRVRELEHFWL